MSGHSHWSTIKHQKAAKDAKRGQLFTKLARAITVAARKGGGDINANSSLRLAVEKARQYSMPKDNVERAIAKGIGKGGGEDIFELTLEGYGPEGVAIMVEALTDNRNRAIQEIRKIFERYGGSLGEQGSAAYIFADRESPLFTVPLADKASADRVLAFVNALDEQDDVQTVLANFDIPDELIEPSSI